MVVKLEDPPTGSSSSAEGRKSVARDSGSLIINADDWGRERETTERIRECIIRGTVSSVSAMVFMEDSVRSAAVGRESGVDAGLHLNLTVPFSAPKCATRLVEHQEKLIVYLRRNRLAQVIYNPMLARSFQYVVTAQLDEFLRLYGAPPDRIDGHHHMHLCANVWVGKLLPGETVVRRNFSFQPGDKGLCNRIYRRIVDSALARRHRLTDYFFPLLPLEPPERVDRIFSLAHNFVVEVETHPVNPEEYRFLTGDEIFRWVGDLRIASDFALRSN